MAREHYYASPQIWLGGTGCFGSPWSAVRHGQRVREGVPRVYRGVYTGVYTTRTLYTPVSWPLLPARACSEVLFLLALLEKCSEKWSEKRKTGAMNRQRLVIGLFWLFSAFLLFHVFCFSHFSALLSLAFLAPVDAALLV